MSESDNSRTRPPKAPDHGVPAFRVGTFLVALALGITLSACGPNRFETRPPAWGDRLQAKRQPVATPENAASESTQGELTSSEDGIGEDPEFYQPGDDVMLRPPPPGIADGRRQSDGDIKLNFQNANLLEVVKVILGDMLNANYTVDPTVQGLVSMQTTRALQQDDLIPTLELLLRQNGAALVPVDEGTYRVVPLATAVTEVRAPQIGDSSMSLPPGFSVRVIPLRYVAADEMAQILTPIVARDNQLLRVDSARNLLILAGGAGDMDRLLETINIFDVDRMAGMSVALFTPEYVEAETLADDLEAVLADPEHGLMPGMIHTVVIERLNGLVVVTPRAEHLAKVRKWVKRLDRNTGDASPRLFVYRVQNGKATELADVLDQLFNPDDGKDTPEASLAPGLEKTTIGEPGAEVTTLTKERRDINDPSPKRSTMASSATRDPTQGFDISHTDDVKIIADEPNNSLLILARGSDYRQILAALKRLDVSPMQVLIEVTIAEVTLTDNLIYGVEWFFRNGIGSREGVGTLDLGAAGIAPIQPGFSWALLSSSNVVEFVINTLATESNLSIISSPSLMVLNNQEASIQVGQEVPVSVQQQQSTVADSNIINSIEYRDTGVLLNVKPRVNAGGLVIMDVEQEVSNIPTTNNADPLTPRITQRRITSTVAVNSGDTIILGGLIEDGRDRSESGIPWFHKIPGIGALFGTKADNQERKELIVLITPRAISNSTAALQVTEEYRRRLQKLIPAAEPDSTVNASAEQGVQ